MASNSKQSGWREFLQLCVDAQTTKSLDKVFHLLLTAEEREALSTRYLIVRELVKGKKTQREMSADLHISIAKITRGSNSLKIIDDELRSLLRREIDES